jgi:hypothetical protein
VTLTTKMPRHSTAFALGVGYAAAEGGYGFCFVGEGGDGIDQARQFENLFDVAGWIEDFEATALAFETHKGAHERANAGAVDLRDASEIDDDLRCATFGQFAQFDAERIIAGADYDATVQIENRNIA